MQTANPDRRQWNLKDILPEDQFESVYKEVEAFIPEFEKELQLLSPDMTEEEFREFCALDERRSRLTLRLAYMPNLWEDTDNESQKVQQMVSRVKDLGTRLATAGRPTSFWLQGKPVEGKMLLDDANAARLFAAVPDLTYDLQRSRALARHTLSQPEEDIITAKDANIQSPLLDLRGDLVTEQRYRVKPKGARRAKIHATQASVTTLYDSPNSDIREAAYRAMLEEYKRNEKKYFRIYEAVVKDWGDEVRRRGYASPINMRNVGNDIPDEAVEALLVSCEKNVGIFQNYFRWKAKRLGMEKLRRFDVYAPLISEKKKMAFEEGIELVLDTFGQLSPVFQAHARRIIDDAHIDSHPSTTKQPGAYCATVVPDLSPYILLNWAGYEDDAFTLAHELGHGVHSLYAAHHSIDVQRSPLPLAETASTFAESVLFDRTLKFANSNQERASLLSNKIADAYGSIIRQNYFVKFEIDMHSRIPQGIKREELSQAWLETLHEQFGDAVEVDPLFQHEWAYIPHIVRTPFYCYSYSFGDLLSMSLYNRYQQDASFFSDIEGILQAGGAENPEAVLKRVGVDIRSPDFWQGGFELIRGWQQQLEKYSQE
jgi:oligoendopeptidase F